MENIITSKLKGNPLNEELKRREEACSDVACSSPKSVQPRAVSPAKNREFITRIGLEHERLIAKGLHQWNGNFRKQTVRAWLEEKKKISDRSWALKAALQPGPTRATVLGEWSLRVKKDRIADSDMKAAKLSQMYNALELERDQDAQDWMSARIVERFKAGVSILRLSLAPLGPRRGGPQSLILGQMEQMTLSYGLIGSVITSWWLACTKENCRVEKKNKALKILCQVVKEARKRSVNRRLQNWLNTSRLEKMDGLETSLDAVKVGKKDASR